MNNFNMIQVPVIEHLNIYILYIDCKYYQEEHSVLRIIQDSVVLFYIIITYYAVEMHRNCTLYVSQYN